MAMPTAGTAQGYFDATLPNRRVEKDELKEWLKIVGEQNFLDDLEADHGVDELWTNARYRNAHLVANLTMAQLRDAGYAEGEALTILTYLVPVPPVAQPAPVAAAPAEINVMMQPDPDADRRSREQSDALSKALSSAIVDKEATVKFIGGANRRPTVRETREYVSLFQSKAQRLDAPLGAAVELLYANPHCDLTAALLGQAVSDKELFGLVRRTLTNAQYTRFGSAMVDSGVGLLQCVFKYTVQIEQKLYNARYAECEAVGKTHNAMSMTKRLELLEERLMEVRFSTKFDITEALDMIYNAVAPVPSLMMEAMTAWHASAKGQDDLDAVLMQAREKAESHYTASNSTQNTPYAKHKVRSGGNTSGSNSHGANSNRSSNSSNSSSQRTRGKCWAFEKSGKCSSSNCPFEHVRSNAQSQRNWRNEYKQKNVNSVRLQTLEAELKQRDELNRALQQQLQQSEQEKQLVQSERDSLECNLLQVYRESEEVDGDRDGPVCDDLLSLEDTGSPLTITTAERSEKSLDIEIMNSRHTEAE